MKLSRGALVGVAGLALSCGSQPDSLPTAPPLSSSAIPLVLGGTIGRSAFPVGNSAGGGQGSPVAGLVCMDESLEFHIHAHLSLFVSGEAIAIPAGIGIVGPILQSGFVVRGTCLYPLHTHDASGIIHVESPSRRTLTLGQLFDIWGQPLGREGVAGFAGPVTAFVNGSVYSGDLRAIAFVSDARVGSHDEITLQVGTPLVTPPVYVFPFGM